MVVDQEADINPFNDTQFQKECLHDGKVDMFKLIK